MMIIIAHAIAFIPWYLIVWLSVYDMVHEMAWNNGWLWMLDVFINDGEISTQLNLYTAVYPIYIPVVMFPIFGSMLYMIFRVYKNDTAQLSL